MVKMDCSRWTRMDDWVAYGEYAGCVGSRLLSPDAMLRLTPGSFGALISSMYEKG
jgi:hypothetical protein